MVLDMFQHFSKQNVKICEIGKNELFFTIFDLKSSVTFLVGFDHF